MDKSNLHILSNESIQLLKQLIAIPSLSKEENKTADCIEQFLNEKNIIANRLLNNVWCCNQFFDESKPSILLNSHLDTVAANSGYTRNPFDAKIQNGNLYGLGSTDAGASLVSLLAAFIFYYPKENLKYNIVFAATAEEEISGINGIEKLFLEGTFKKYFLHKDSFAIVGEPTQLQLAIAEKGLLVLDCNVKGIAGHAAREEGVNGIYKAMSAIDWIKNYQFPKVSSLLGAIKMTVTSINTENMAHNVVPAMCSFVVDVRVNELYTHAEIIAVINEHIDVVITPRSMRLRSSSIQISHPIIQAGISLGKQTYGSPTLSDKALIPFPTLKCGVGNSAQSHTADEFVVLEDIEKGIEFYVKLLQQLVIN